VAAYDDAMGVTAQFNKNLLVRINRELRGDFDLNAFDHRAIWNAHLQRMEMHLVSRIDQLVHVAGRGFAFKAGERLHTESSHKFSIESFNAGEFSGMGDRSILAQRHAGVCHLQFDFARLMADAGRR
jgi:uncharacterized SAM-dependent methyltransferase